MTVPPDTIAQVCASPAAMAVAPVTPETATGMGEVVKALSASWPQSPLPSWPQRLSPQHLTAPPDTIVQECSAPDARKEALVVSVPASGPVSCDSAASLDAS